MSLDEHRSRIEEHNRRVREHAERVAREEPRSVGTGRGVEGISATRKRRGLGDNVKVAERRRQKVEQGLCAFCQNRRNLWAFMCDVCADKHRERQRRKSYREARGA